MTGESWFKHHDSASLLSDDLKEITPAEECAWWRLLCVVSLEEERGATRIRKGLAEKLRLPSRPHSLMAFLRRLESLGMVTIDGEAEVVTVVNWPKYQGARPPSWSPEASRERQQRSRERRMSQPVTTLSQPPVTTVTSVEERRGEERREEGEGEVVTPPPANGFEVDLAVGRLCRVWEQQTGTTVSPAAGDLFADYLGRLPEEAITKAIVETGANGAKGWKYTQRILERYERDGWKDEPEPVEPELASEWAKIQWRTALSDHMRSHKCSAGCAELAVGSFERYRVQRQVVAS